MANVTSFGEIAVDSRDRIGGPPENAIIQFPDGFNIQQFKLKECEIPVTYYNIYNINTNFLKIDFDEEDGSGDKTATVADAPTTAGYTLSEFITAIETAINAASTSALHTYTVTYDTPSNKVTITNTHVSGTDFILRWQSGTNKRSQIADMLGFNNLLDLNREPSYTGTSEINITVNNLLDVDATQTKIPVGSYTAVELESQLKVSLDAATGDTFTITTDLITNKYTLASTGVYEMLFATGPNNKISDLDVVLGFIGDKTGTTSYTSDNVINLAFENYIFLKSTSVIGNDQGVTVANSVDGNLIARIQISEATDGIQFYTNISDFSIDIANVVTVGNTLDFQLTFRNNVPIDFNGHGWSARFEVTYT